MDHSVGGRPGAQGVSMLLLLAASCSQGAEPNGTGSEGAPKESHGQSAYALFREGLEIEVTTACGVEEGRNPFSEERELIAVKVQLESDRPTPQVGRLSARLKGGLGSLWVVPVSGESDVRLERGDSIVRTFWFRYDDVPASAEVEVTLQHPSGVRETESQDVKFACVAACPPFNVMVRRELGSSDLPDPGGACPALPGEEGDFWKGLLAAQTTELSYCSYSWQHPGGAQPNLRSFDAIDAADKQVDCPAASGARALSLEDLAQATSERLGIDAAEAALAPTGWPQALTPVRLAVLDTAALSFTDARNDNSDHGRAVGLLANWIACGHTSTPCREVRIDNRLAIPILDLERQNGAWTFETDLNRGGVLASQGHIAHALHALLETWDPKTPMIANLAFAWHSKHDCQTPGCGQNLHEDRVSDPLVPTGTGLGYVGGDGDGDGDGDGAADGINHSLGAAAVLTSIARARCLGAAVIAAAGNAEGGGPSSGPLLPGGWNRLDASKLNCAAFGLSRALTGPLVFAVGAIDATGVPIALTRRHSIPPIVALGSGITLTDSRRSNQIRGPFGGTSLATAVVSGSAARLWAHMGPKATAEQVMSELLRHGDPLAGRTEEEPAASDAEAPAAALCVKGQTCPSPVEINACSVVKALEHLKLLTGTALPCEIERVAPAAPASTVEPVSCTLPTEEEVAALKDDPATVTSADVAAVFGVCDESNAGEIPVLGPLVDKLEAPWALPQPTGPVCPTCLEQRIDFYDDDYLEPWTRYTVEFDQALIDQLASAHLQVNETVVGLNSALIQVNSIVGKQEFSLLSMSAAPLLRAELLPSSDATLGVIGTVSLELTPVSVLPGP